MHFIDFFHLASAVAVDCTISNYLATIWLSWNFEKSQKMGKIEKKKESGVKKKLSVTRDAWRPSNSKWYYGITIRKRLTRRSKIVTLLVLRTRMKLLIKKATMYLGYETWSHHLLSSTAHLWRPSQLSTSGEKGLCETQTAECDHKQTGEGRKLCIKTIASEHLSPGPPTCVKLQWSSRNLLLLSSWPFLSLLVLWSRFFSKNVDVLTMNAASPSQSQVGSACSFLHPIVADLLKNLFDDEPKCGDKVSPLTKSTHYEHLSKDRTTGSWCSASCFPWCHRNFSNIRVVTFTLRFVSPPNLN